MILVKGEFLLSSCFKRNIIEIFNSSNKIIVIIVFVNNLLIFLEVKVICFCFLIFLGLMSIDFIFNFLYCLNDFFFISCFFNFIF